MEDGKLPLKAIEKLKGIIDDEDIKVVQLFSNAAFGELFEKIVEDVSSEPASAEEIYNEIVVNYFTLLSLLNVNRFSSFHFPDYEDCRKVLVDGNEYDLDSEFCHDDSEATNALYAIDCLTGDLEEDSFERILKKIEKKMNAQIQEIK